MKREFLTTGDGSTTIHLPEWNEQYHSKHGAINEAKHVFINMGLHHVITTNKLSKVAVLEIGFGTGLNALLTALQTSKKLEVHYTGVEGYPIKNQEYKLLNYPKIISNSKVVFNRLHQSVWEESVLITEHFSITKQEKLFHEIEDTSLYDLIYFDAFGARVQPDLWTETVFTKMFNALRSNGVLVTYAAKGSVRRAMQAVGFTVERLPGPPGKREMLRATKTLT